MDTSRSTPQWPPAVSIESTKLLAQFHEECLAVRDRRIQHDEAANQAMNLGIETGIFGREFWQVTVPYLFRQNASVWYANMAIHALIDSKHPSFMDEEDRPTELYRRALRYHGIALGQLRKEVISRGNLQSATLCCLFFVIFEMMNGDHEAALAHVSNGCKLMTELHGAAQRGPLHEDGVQVSRLLYPNLQTALRFVALQSRRPSQEVLSPAAVDGILEALAAGGNAAADLESPCSY